jgi:hypothetical protein
MVRSQFVVQHFVFCASIDYRDRTRPNRNTILDGVDYVFGAPPGTEFPFEPDEFWLYARLYSTTDDIGECRPLTVTCSWLDSPGSEDPVEIWQRAIGPLRFVRPHGVIDRSWVFRNTESEATYRFPAAGRYEFALWHSTKKFPNRRVVAREFVRIEAQP